MTVDPYYLPNYPHVAYDPAADDRTCPDDCNDTAYCGCNCSQLICLEHGGEAYETCELYGPVYIDHHADVCRNPFCLGLVDSEPVYWSETYERYDSSRSRDE